MYFNRATIFEYLERYAEAVNDYNLAHSIDPNLKGDFKSNQLVTYMIQTATFVQSRGKSQQKRLLELVKSIPTTLPSELRFPQVEEKK